MSEVIPVATPDNPTMEDRNQAIKRLIASGKRPLLPFEIIALRRMHNLPTSNQIERYKGAAGMINADSFGLSKREGQPARIVREAVDLGYPNKYLGHVTLGSLVAVRYPDGDLGSVLITGAVTELPDFERFGLPEGCEALTLHSPLGCVILGTEIGAKVSYPAGGEVLHANVVDLQQINLS